jgi:protein-S-isoprenylcysteine O-methyltransferase Ste14
MVLLTAMAIGLVLAFWLPSLVPQATITWHRRPLFFVGTALMLLGVALRWYAIRVLGRYFTRNVAVRPGQEVVQAGPYRFIRHPAYSGSLLSYLGIGLALTNWASIIAIMFCTLLGYGYRVRVEEQVLCQALGQPYREYMRHTRRLIPFVL